MNGKAPGPEETSLHRAETAEEVEQIFTTTRLEIDARGWMGATPLHSSAKRGRVDVVVALLRRGADVGARRPERRETPLHFAATGLVARVLLEAGAEVESLDWIGRTPLHWAAQFGHSDAAAVLIEFGATVDRPAADGMTPLHWAAQEGHDAVVAGLLAAGGQVDPLDEEGRTPLHLAAWRGRAAIVLRLLEAGADPNRRSSNGEVSRHAAIRSSHDAVASLLSSAQGPAALAERPANDLAVDGAVGFLKVRTHPTRPELVTTARSAVIARWNIAGPARIEVGVQAPYALFGDIAVGPSASGMVAVATSGQAVECRRWDDLQVVCKIRLPAVDPKDDTLCNDAQALDLSSDGRWMAVADSCEQLHLIERATGRVVATAEAGERTYALRFDPSSRLLATACSYQGGGLVRIDRIEDGQLVAIAELARNQGRTAGQEWVDRLSDITNSVTRRKRPDRAGFVDTLAHLDFSPNGRSLALFETSAIGHSNRPIGWRGDVVLFDTATWEVRWVASVDQRRTGDRRPLATAGYPMGFATEVLFVDDAIIACGATRGWVLFYQVSDGELVRRLQVHPSAPVVSLALEPASRTLWAVHGGGGPPVRVSQESGRSICDL